MKVNIFWFRRDLRIGDNCGLFNSLQNNHKVIPIFIFDTNFFEQFKANDKRFSFLHDTLEKLHNELKGSLLVLKGKPIEVFQKLLNTYNVQIVFANEEYEPYSRKRDNEIKEFLTSKNIQLKLYKDFVIFHKNEILNRNQQCYSVFTPYKNEWLKHLNKDVLKTYPSEKYLHNIHNVYFKFPSNLEGKVAGMHKLNFLQKKSLE